MGNPIFLVFSVSVNIFHGFSPICKGIKCKHYPDRVLKTSKIRDFTLILNRRSQATLIKCVDYLFYTIIRKNVIQRSTSNMFYE